MNDSVHDQLLAMLQRDIAARARLLQAGKLYGTYDEEMQAVHRDNARLLDDIISRQGWPGITMVGLEGCRAAWQIAQHANCTPGLQRKFLELLTEATRKGDAPLKQAAMLTDLIRFNEGLPQRFGTVLDWDESGELNCEVEDRDDLDSRRMAVGLPAFQADLEAHRREIAAEGGKCPQNIREYRQGALDWARRSGWR